MKKKKHAKQSSTVLYYCSVSLTPPPPLLQHGAKTMHVTALCCSFHAIAHTTPSRVHPYIPSASTAGPARYGHNTSMLAAIPSRAYALGVFVYRSKGLS